MMIIQSHQDIHKIVNSEIKCLVEMRIGQFLDTCEIDPFEYSQFIIIDDSDHPREVEAITGGSLSIESSLECSTDLDLHPGFEFIEEHATCYELLYLTGDSGSGIEIIIPKSSGIDREISAFCRFHLAPCTTPTEV